MGKQKILFGAGITGRTALNHFGEKNVFCFADNNKSGQTFLGKQVISVDELAKIASNYDVILTISVTKITLIKQIKRQLMERSILCKTFNESIDISTLQSNQDIAKFCNIHKGESCFVIANGPSLRCEDLYILMQHKITCFGSNTINEIFKYTQWRPNYYYAQDPIMMNSYVNELANMEVQHKFVPDPRDVSIDSSDALKALEDGKGECHYYFGLRIPVEDITFSEDLSKLIMLGGTVTGGLIQLARYMGFRKIFLLGADWTYTDINDKDYFQQKRHFYTETIADITKQQGVFLVPVPDDDTRQQDNLVMCELKKFCEKRGTQIFNATRGGILEVFERVNFDDLFKDGDLYG